jgi:ribosomal protein S18 acetylase RimI-like enzyme
MMAVNIRYQLIAPEQYEEALAVLNKYYIPDEPMCRALKCTDMKPSKVMDAMIMKTLSKGLSWCAIDDSTGEIVGVKINSEKTLANPLDVATLTYEQCMGMGLSHELALMHVLASSVLDFKQLMLDHNETKMISFVVLTVHQSYRNKGIATELIKRSLAHLIELGYTFAGVICTGSYSQKIYNKLEFTKVKEVEYASYLDPVTNTYVFKDIEEPHKSIIGYVKKLV